MNFQIKELNLPDISIMSPLQLKEQQNLMEEILMVKKMPPSIKQWYITPPSKPFTDYLYIFINLDNGKIYLGKHLYGKKIYWQSSKNKEFKKVFANGKSNLLFIVLEYGNSGYIEYRENSILVANNAASSDDWYNLWNSYTKYEGPRMDKIKKFYDLIKSGKYITDDIIPKEKLKDIEFHQSRLMQTVPGAISDLCEILDESGGDTEECDPPVVLKDRNGIGQDSAIGGTHTSKSVYIHPNTIGVKWNYIPYEEHCFFTDNELKIIGSWLNKKEERYNNEITEDDALYVLQQWYEDGKEMSDKDIRDYLRGCGFKPGRVDSIKRAYDNEKAKRAALNRGGLQFADYSPKSALHHKLEETRQLYESDEVAACIYSSAAPKLNNIIMHGIDKNSIVCILYHKSPYWEKIWNNSLKKEFEATINWFGLKDKTITFIEMPSWVPAKTKI